jgi:TetR/AcrR family transcriptional regulator, transcriptional repressor of bet genes
MGRPPTTEVRRRQIVEALLRVMAERGYERASVAEIAREAGLAPGLVHYHFATKQEILLSLVDALAEGAGQRIDERLAGAGAEPLSRVDAFIDALLERGSRADPAAVACWVAVGAEAIEQPEVREAFGRAVLGLRDRLAPLLGAAAPHLARRERAGAAAAVLAAVQGYFLLSSAVPGAVPAGSAAPAARAMARALLAAPAPGARPAPRRGSTRKQKP